MPIPITAVIDACVLYSAPLRDLLVEAAVGDLFQARWTAEIHDEWMRNLRADRPDIAPRNLERTRTLMDTKVSDCLVTGHLWLIPTLTLPDPDDRHVLAAAIHCGAGVIVTKNLKDFPAALLDQYRIQAHHPDSFLVDVLDANELAMCSTVRAVRGRLKNPPKTVADFLLTLERQELARTVERLREFVDLL